MKENWDGLLNELIEKGITPEDIEIALQMYTEDIAVKTKAMFQARASLEHEGLVITPEIDVLVFKNVTGQISDEELQNEALRIAKAK